MSLLYHPEQEIVVCSPMEGRISYKGTPVSGAKVERFLKWKDEQGRKDSVVTDEHGNFSLPIVKESAKLPKLSQLVIAQEIRVYLNAENYLIWAKAKRDKGLYDELNGQPINFRCELTDEPTLYDSGDESGGTLITSCKWDSIQGKE